MLMLCEAREEQRDLRLSLKTQEQNLIREAMTGAGLSRWDIGVQILIHFNALGGPGTQMMAF